MKPVYNTPTIIEFNHREPLPPMCKLVLKNIGIVVVASNQLNIDKSFTIRAILADQPPEIITIKPKTMNLEVIKKELGNLGFPKAQVDIILDTIKAVPHDPGLYACINSTVLEALELRVYKGSVASALKDIGIATGGEKKKAPAKPKKKETVIPAPQPEPAAPVLTATLGGKKGGKKTPPPQERPKEEPKFNGPVDDANDDLAMAKNVAESMPKIDM